MTGSSADCRSVKTTCPYCGVGCGVVATPDGKGSAKIKGDTDHPANYGRLCSKGSALGETLDLEERLLFPTIEGARSDWDSALDMVASRFSETIREYGPDSVAFYVSGQLLTEDYYVANKLMKGFIGSSNIDTNSRLCMASSVAGHKRAFGSDTVPGRYEDLEKADLVVLVGSNLAWCHPVLHQRLLSAKDKQNFKLVVIDPRKTATTEAADLHLAIKPGADVALFNGLFARLAASHAKDEAYVSRHTAGLGDALKACGEIELAEIAHATGLSETALKQFYDWFEATSKTVTVYSQGVNQSSAGADKVNAILNCHLVTGRIGREGMGPFSVTGQPNAMGGREVGGLANQLAAHMDFAPGDVDRVRRFWKSPSIAEKPGLKAVDLYDAIERGEIKALWVMATNPVVSMPNADKVKKAIQACPFVVVSDVVETSDTVKLAHVQLPATAWGEKTGTVTNSERCISRQRSFFSPPGEARHDWDIVSDVARRMGFDGFDYQDEAEIFREYASMTGFENSGQRDLDISAYDSVSREAYDALEPFYWPAPKDGKGIPDERFFAKGGFYTPNRQARFVSTSHRFPQSKTSKSFPLVMNTGRVRDHWHTMTRTGKTARLSSHIGEPYLELHPSDAKALNLKHADLVEVSSALGKSVLRLVITERVKTGECFAPFHWTSRYASNARVDALVPSNVDPVSGQPESKFTPVRVHRLNACWYGFLVTLNEPTSKDLSDLAYWSKARAGDGWNVEIAGADQKLNMECITTLLVGNDDVLSMVDQRSGRLCTAKINTAGELVAFAVASRTGPVAADRSWVSKLIGQKLDNEQRAKLLAGRPPVGQSTGRIVCSCFGIGSKTIQNAAQEGSVSVTAIGEKTCAGTNCGSCKPEIAKILTSVLASSSEQSQVAAE